MSFDPNIPRPTDLISDSQGDIQANFAATETAFNLNHGNFNAADEGKHTVLNMPEQSGVPATPANEAAFFAQLSSLTAQTELVFRREGGTTDIEFTGLTGATNGWTRLPSGILLKWGSAVATGATTINFPVAASVPVFTSVFQVLATVTDSSVTPNTFVTVRGTTITNTSFGVTGSSRTSTTNTTVNFSYLAIGL